jgi:hypothetical protein
MDHAFKWILIWGGTLSVILFILWPCLALPARVFSKVRLGSVPLHASCYLPLEQSVQQANTRDRLLATAALGHSAQTCHQRAFCLSFLQGYFTFWVIISMTWGFIATIISIVLVGMMPT